MGTSKFNTGGNPTMDWHLIQKRVQIHATETEDSLMDHLTGLPTLPYYY